MAVTDNHKCYVYVCAGCKQLAYSERSDALTCSTRCRVAAHRNGWLKTLHGIADLQDVPTSMILQVKAIDQLRPDLIPKIRDGALTVKDAQAEVWPMFWSLLMKQE